MGYLPPICIEMIYLWTARVPLICWKCVEWHLPDRVMRQFSAIQTTCIVPIDRNFKREDGRGHADRDWMVHHAVNITIWNNRDRCIMPVQPHIGDDAANVRDYLRWYKSWAKIYLCEPPTEPPTGFNPASPRERELVDYIYTFGEIAERGSYGDPATMQGALQQITDLSRHVRESMYIEHEPRYQSPVEPGRRSYAGTEPSIYPGTSSSGPRRSDYAGPSTSAPRRSVALSAPRRSIGPSEHERPSSSYMPHWSTPQPMDITFHLGPTYAGTPINLQPITPEEPQEEGEEGYQLRDRPRRPATRYTPGSDALRWQPRK